MPVNAVPFRSAREIEMAIPMVRDHLAGGGLIAYPTETVYGLGSRPVGEDVARLAELKGRPRGKPFLLLVASRAMAERYGLEFTRAARAVADRFWPGPITLVLPGGPALPELLRGPEGGIAVRWTAHKGIERLIAELDYPLTSTSANPAGQATAPGVAAILEAFEPAVRQGILLVLDGGVLGNVPPSTVVDCTGERLKIVRAGAIPPATLRTALGSLVA